MRLTAADADDQEDEDDLEGFHRCSLHSQSLFNTLWTFQHDFQFSCCFSEMLTWTEITEETSECERDTGFSQTPTLWPQYLHTSSPLITFTAIMQRNESTFNNYLLVFPVGFTECHWRHVVMQTHLYSEQSHCWTVEVPHLAATPRWKHLKYEPSEVCEEVLGTMHNNWGTETGNFTGINTPVSGHHDVNCQRRHDTDQIR